MIILKDLAKHVNFTAPDAKILIVDDSETNLKITEGLMFPYEVEVDACKSGEDSIEMIKSQIYDVIFMDHMMPGMDGIETTDIIRSFRGDYFKNVPIIALSANAVFGIKDMFLQNGMNDFLEKPIDTSKLADILKKWIPLNKQKQSFPETLSEGPNTKLQIEGIDVETGLCTGCTVEYYMKILELFCRDCTEMISEIQHYAESDIKLYKIRVHAIKSSAASIGAKEISCRAMELEDAAAKGDINFIKNNTSHFIQKLEELIKNINTSLQSNKNQTPQEQIPKNELETLKTALKSFDIRTINETLVKLESKNWDHPLKAVISDISKNIILFEYERSVALIDKLLYSKHLLG